MQPNSIRVPFYHWTESYFRKWVPPIHLNRVLLVINSQCSVSRFAQNFHSSHLSSALIRYFSSKLLKKCSNLFYLHFSFFTNNNLHKFREEKLHARMKFRNWDPLYHPCMRIPLNSWKSKFLHEIKCLHFKQVKKDLIQYSKHLHQHELTNWSS